MALDLFVTLAAIGGALFGAWMLLFLGFGRKLEAMEIEAEAIEQKPEAERTPLEVHKLKLWKERQSFLESHKYRLVTGLLIGVAVAIGYIAIFMQDATAQQSIMAAAVAGWGFGSAGSAFAKEIRANG